MPWVPLDIPSPEFFPPLECPKCKASQEKLNFLDGYLARNLHFEYSHCESCDSVIEIIWTPTLKLADE